MSELGARILVVEDESLIAAHIAENLVALGYRVSGVAASGAQALRLLRDAPPDLILMDITLKGEIDGIAVARQLRSTRRIPVVFLTAHADDATLKRASLTDPYGYIVKPFSDRELKTTIEMALYKHRMETKLHESEQWLGTTLRSVADAVVATSGDGHISFMNPAAEALTGWTTSAAEGQPFGTVFVLLDERGVALPNPLQHVLGAGEALGSSDSATLRAQGGLTCPIEHRAAPIRDETGIVRGGVIVFRDISERRRTQELFQRLIENSSDVITVIARDGVIRYESASIERVLGFSAGELTGRVALELVHPDDVARTKLGFEQLLRSTGELMVLEVRVRHKDGSFRTLETSSNNLLDHEAVRGVIVNSRDVTERKSLEAKLAQADRLATVGALAAGVGHEITNPLSYALFNMEELASELPRVADAIRRYRDVLITHVGPEQARALLGETWERYAQKGVEQLATRAEEATEGARRIGRIVRDLRTFSRLDAEPSEAVQIDVVVESALSMASTAIRHRAKIMRDYGRTPPALANASRLAQVFLNLVVNAVQSLPDGAGDANEIGVRTWVEGSEICAEVRDTGAGIEPEHLARVFEPFFTTKPVGVGTGLGLSISHGIVASYGGRIEVKSERFKGSRFTVRLPLPAEARPTERRTDRARQLPPGKPPSAVKVRVLVIDDDARVGKTLARILSDCDATVVGSAAQARELIERDRNFDVLFCDLMMPGENGMDFYRWAEGRRAELATRFIFTTGGAFTESTRSFVEHVPCATVEKPFNTAAIRSAMERVLVSRRLDRPTDVPPKA